MGKLILIAEDDSRHLLLLRHLLNLSGYATIEAADGKKAVELARERRPDLIVMDINMPVMNGIEAAKMLKSDPQTKCIPLLAFTAFAGSKDRVKILSAGYCEYFTKPIDIKPFVKRISEYLHTG